MKHALVIGNEGFVGRHLVPRLECLGYAVFGTENFAHFLLDYRSEMHRWDVIIHLGANIVNVDARMKGGMKMFDDIALDLAVCKYVETHVPIECFVVMSSCAVDFPDDPYCTVKRTLEAFATSLHKIGVPVCILRPFSGYGPDQSPEYPFRAIFERALAGENPVSVWGGYQVRDWLHIDDLVSGITHGMQGRFPYGEPVELGTMIPTKLFDLAKQIVAAVNPALNVCCDTTKATSSGSRIATSSIAAKYGWKHSISLATGIQLAAQFYRAQGRLL